MSGFRPRQSKLLGDLLASLASAAVVGAAGAAYSAVGELPLSGPVPVWLAASASVIAAGAGFAYAGLRHPDQDRVFFVSSAFSQKHWLAALLANLIRSLDHESIDLALKLPAHDYSGLSQIQQLDKLARKARSFTGGFVVAAEPEAVRPELDSFCQSTRLPVVFVDIRPYPRAEDYPPRTAFVGYRAEEIGRQAADWVCATAEARGLTRPSVLVVGGEGQRARHEVFAAELARRLPSADVTLNLQGMFARDRAREIVERQLRAKARLGAYVDLIYCTSDEMALGAVDAVQALTIAGTDCGDVAVIGVDGTEEAVAAIRSGGTPLRATVVQDPRRIAETAVALLLKLRAGQPVPVETFIPTAMFPPE